jgi:hypothetical protein
LPANTIAAIAGNGLASIGDMPEFAVSTETSLHMDDAPQNLGTAAPAKSMWQEDMLAIKLKFRLSWTLRHPAAAAWVQGCAW